MELGECSSSTPRQDQRMRGDTFDGITPHASSSSSAVMRKGPWDVFINHRGCDTKNTLASTIYHTLDLVGLRAFLDVEELELGDSIPQEIEEAVQTAGLHIAIFSEKYAESPWCLAELCYMLKIGTPILPVFYHVNPDDLRWVRKGKGCYAHAFSQHEEKGRYPSSMLADWKTALERVSNLSGHVLKSNTGDEGMLLKSIVNSVLRAMKKEPLEVAKHPVGMDEIVEDFETSRQEYIESEQQVQIMGIVGFGGSGKTTLATELYNKKSASFDHFSFVHDGRDAASKNALHTKQKKLLDDLRIKTASFDSLREGKAIIADRLKTLRALVVLDDVDHEDQLDALLPPKESLRSGSLVIVTSREGEVLSRWGITSIYRMRPLRRPHAKQLFCWHAFLRPSPQECFEDLVEKYLDVCNGLPLSLKVIGGQLYGKRSRDYWVSQIERIGRILPKEILQRLKVSYDALDEEEKEIFMDVACFFIGQRRSSAIAVWDGSGWSGQCSWETLHNKCLVEVYVDELGEERIRMHDHLRDIGRQIAKTHSPSRIWFERQSMPIQRGTQIRGIMAATAGTRQRSNNLHWPPPFKEYMEMMRSSNLTGGLHLLAVKENDFSAECEELSGDFLWLRWFDFEHSFIPSWLSLENIRVLEFIDPGLETLWEEAHPPLELRELLIQKAINFQSFPRSIGHLKHLKRLSLQDGSLSSLPEEFCQLLSLERLDLSRCEKLLSLPKCFGNLVNLRHIDLSFCKSLEMLPVSFKQLIHLEYLYLNSCVKLFLELDILEDIINLKAFDVSDCHKLERLPHNITNQAFLKELVLRSTSSLRELPASIDHLRNLELLQICSCPLLTRLPTSLGNLYSLISLRLIYCDKLKSLPIEIGQLHGLQTLGLEICPELCEIPSLAGLVSLNDLRVENCPKINKIEGLEHLKSLEEMLVWTFWMVPGIHSLCGTERLRTLNLRAGDISAFEPLIKSMQIENWPWEMTISANINPRARSFLDSFTFPGLTSVNWSSYSVTSCETNLSNAVIVYIFVNSYTEGRYVGVEERIWTTGVEVGLGFSIVITVFREVSHLIKDGDHYLQASLNAPYSTADVLDVTLIVGERGRVLEGLKQLFQTLCKATSMEQYYC